MRCDDTYYIDYGDVEEIIKCLHNKGHRGMHAGYSNELKQEVYW